MSWFSRVRLARGTDRPSIPHATPAGLAPVGVGVGTRVDTRYSQEAIHDRARLVAFDPRTHSGPHDLRFGVRSQPDRVDASASLADLGTRTPQLLSELTLMTAIRHLFGIDRVRLSDCGSTVATKPGGNVGLERFNTFLGSRATSRRRTRCP